VAKLDQLLQEVRTAVGADFIVSAVVGADGLAIASISVAPEFDVDSASASIAMSMKLASRVAAQIGLGVMEDYQTTTDKAFVLVRLMEKGYVWGMAVAKSATLGSIRILMKEYAEPIWDAIPAR
jgi:predicted regulator of Ras-like GTPase activity (Roadblock/LC7/MglB family)